MSSILTLSGPEMKAMSTPGRGDIGSVKKWTPLAFRLATVPAKVAGVNREVVQALITLQSDLRGGAVADVEQRAAKIDPRPLLAVAHGAFFQHGVKISLVERHRGVDVGGFVVKVMQLKFCHRICPPWIPVCQAALTPPLNV